MKNSPPLKSPVNFWVRQIFSAILLLTIGFFYSKHIDLNVIKALLNKADLALLAIAYSLAIMVLWIRTLRWGRLLKEFAITIKGTTLFLMYLVDIFFNNFISGLSMAIRGLYIQEEIGNSKLIVRLLLIDKLFDWIIPVSLGLISLMFVLLQWQSSHVWRVWVGIIILLPYLAWKILAWLQILAGYSGWPHRLNKVHAKLLSLLSVDLNKHHLDLFLRIFAFSITAFAVYYLVLLLLAKCFALPIGLTELIMADTMATISVVIPLNFAGIGTRDVALVALLTYYQCPHESIVLFIASLVLLRLGMSVMGWGSMHILKQKGYSIAMKL